MTIQNSYFILQEYLKGWIKPCTNHLHWSATTTPSGNGKIIWAKFKSFLSHIVNKHSDLDAPLFNKGAHRDITDRTWLQTGEKVLHSDTCDGQFFLKTCLISTEQSSLISSMLLNQYPFCLSLFYNSLFASVQVWQILLICTLLSFFLINGKCFCLQQMTKPMKDYAKCLQQIA